MVVPPGGGHSNHRRHIRDFPGVLDVITVISNPVRWRSRYDLYRAFAKHMDDSGVRLTTVELAYGDRPFEITECDTASHVQFRTRSELWHKENLINLGISRLPADWKYVAWIDADIQFARMDWAQETLHQLQHYALVQPWSHAQDLGPKHEPMDRHSSFCYCNAEHSTVPFSDRSSKVNDLKAQAGTAQYALKAEAYAAPAVKVASSTPTFPSSSIYNWHPGFA